MTGKLLVALLPLLAFPPQASSPFTGDGVGGAGSRACTGGLRMRPHTLDWETTWSTCDRTPYDILSQRSGKVVYRLHPRNRSCKFRVMEMERIEEAWVATGFPTEAGWRNHDYVQETSCAYFVGDGANELP